MDEERYPLGGWSHYKGELQQIMSAAVRLAAESPKGVGSDQDQYDDELETFHRQVADILKDPSILKHFVDARMLNNPTALPRE